MTFLYAWLFAVLLTGCKERGHDARLEAHCAQGWRFDAATQVCVPKE